MKHAEFNYVVEPQRTCPNGRLPMTTLITWMIEAASAHAENRGFGFTRLRENNTSWVLARLAVEMNEYPKAYEQVRLETWVDDFNRFFSTRNFALLGSSDSDTDNETAFGYAKTQWSMIDLSTRKACDLSDMSGIAEFKEVRPCPIDPPGKIATVNSSACEQYSVRYSDIDVNRHVNTVKYIEHALDLFSLDFFDNNHLKRMEVQFIAEVRFGDTLSFHLQETSKKVFSIEIRNQSEEPVNRLKLAFEPNQFKN